LTTSRPSMGGGQSSVLSFDAWWTKEDLPRVGLGCWRLCAPGRPSWEAACRTIEAAYESGARLFDTADAYAVDETEHGYGERLVRAALAGRRDVVVVTKGGWARPGGVWEARCTRDWVARAVEQSAERLGTETIDVYLLHGVDPKVDLLESLAPIFAARRAGRIRWVGLSNVSVAQVRRAMEEGPIDVVQNRLSVTVRPEGSEAMLRFCADHGIRFMAHTPFGPTLWEGDRRRVRDAAPVRRIAEARGMSPEVVALAWLLGLSPRALVIPGARRSEAIQDSMRATACALSRDEMRELSGWTEGS
jgi:aryl-alcohol dehydrogenase-like predicted oxidoreductase